MRWSELDVNFRVSQPVDITSRKRKELWTLKSNVSIHYGYKYITKYARSVTKFT